MVACFIFLYTPKEGVHSRFSVLVEHELGKIIPSLNAFVLLMPSIAVSFRVISFSYQKSYNRELIVGQS